MKNYLEKLFIFIRKNLNCFLHASFGLKLTEELNPNFFYFQGSTLLSKNLKHNDSQIVIEYDMLYFLCMRLKTHYKHRLSISFSSSVLKGAPCNAFRFCSSWLTELEPMITLVT